MMFVLRFGDDDDVVDVAEDENSRSGEIESIYF